MKNRIIKIAAIIFFIIVILFISYEASRLSSALKEKKDLKFQLGDLLKQKNSLEENLSRISAELKLSKDRLKPAGRGIIVYTELFGR